MTALSICREYEFAAAHKLTEHDGKCRELHGHNYKLEVEVSGVIAREGPKTGMIMDFSDLDRVVDSYLKQIDHTYLNESLPEVYPTAENLCGYLWTLLYPRMISREDPLNTRLKRLRLYETEKSWAEVTA